MAEEIKNRYRELISMDSYAIRKNSPTSFTVIVTSPKNQMWKTLSSAGLTVTEEHRSGDGQDYSWIVQAEKPGNYELRMLRQSVDGAFRQFVIPLSSESA
jgi:predicted DNA binding protein